jgi:hypothetical protein
MFERLLSVLAQGGVYSYADLARQLGVGEGLLQRMVADLVEWGYLRPVTLMTDECQGGCKGCSLAGACAMRSPIQLWAPTEKARQLLEQSVL